VTPLPVLLALTAGVSNMLLGAAGKQAERADCRPAVVPVLMLGTVAVLASTLLPFTRGGWGDGGVWVLAATMGLLYVAALQSMIAANKHCPPSLVWSLANLGLLIPIMLAPVVLHESWHVTDIILVLAFVAMLGSFRQGMRQAGEQAPGARSWWLLTGVWLCNGLLMLGYKLKAQSWPAVGTVPFLVLVFGCGALLGALTLFRVHPRATGVEWRLSLLMGVAATVANAALLGAVTLPAVVAFPLVQGTALIGGTLLMAVRFREQLNIWKIIGLCCGGLVLALAIVR